MNAIEEAKTLLNEVQSKPPSPGYNAGTTLIYCKAAFFCSRIIAEAILEAAEKVRVPYGQR